MTTMLKGTLTNEYLKKTKPGKIFAYGDTPDSSEGVNMSGSGKNLRWVAVRGGIEDWAIYAYLYEPTPSGGIFETTDYDKLINTYVAKHGYKVRTERNIRKLVPCEDNAYMCYRF